MSSPSIASQLASVAFACSSVPRGKLNIRQPGFGGMALRELNASCNSAGSPNTYSLRERAA